VNNQIKAQQLNESTIIFVSLFNLICSFMLC
jgi:hypothetical protein